MAEREIMLRVTMKSDSFREAVRSAEVVDGELAAMREEQDRRLGEVTRLALAGDGILAVVRRDNTGQHPERFGEVTRLLLLAIHHAAWQRPGDAVDAARSALACCPDVPALAADVARIIAILEAP